MSTVALMGNRAYPSTSPAKPSLKCETLRGEQEILAFLEPLRLLAERCGQEGAVAYLAFFLSACKLGAKVPHLLTFSDSHGNLVAAVLFHQYCVFGVSTGIFLPADFCGERNVIAPKPSRTDIGRHAADLLMQRGARLVLVSLRDGDFAGSQPVNRHDRPRKTFNCGIQSRQVIRALPVAQTYDETLASMGGSTRRNLRRFRRRAEMELGATFQKTINLSEVEFLALNLVCSYPVPHDVASWRFRTVHEIEGSLFVGMQAADGTWLSLMGGRHRHGTTFIDWQMNVKSLPSYSLGTVMRAFLLEYEVERGSGFVCFEGGTPHSMHRAFLPEQVSDLLYAHRFLTPNLLRKGVARILPKGHLLADLLEKENFTWSRVTLPVRTKQ